MLCCKRGNNSEVEVDKKLSLKLLSLIQNTLLLRERCFGRGEGKQRVPAGLRGMPVLCSFCGLETLLDEAGARFSYSSLQVLAAGLCTGGVSVL